MTTPRTLFLVLSLFLPASSAQATGQLQATATAERTTVQLGQPVRVTVFVRNSDGAPEIQVPKTSDFTIGPPGPAATRPSALAGVEPLRPGGPIPGKQLIDALREATDKATSAQIDSDMARQLQAAGFSQDFKTALADLKKDDYTVTFLVQPSKTGAVTLPAFTVASGGQTVTTKPVALTVNDPQPQNWVRLNLSLSNPAPLPGDEVQLYVDLMIRRGPVALGAKMYPHYPVQDVTLNVPAFGDVPQLELVRPLDQVLRERAIQPGQHGFRVDNVPGEYILEHEPADAPKEGEWYRRRLTIPVRVRNAGKVVIPPAKVGGEVYVPAVGSKTGKWVPFTASSEPATAAGRDLGDRPRDFTGGVGTFRLTAKASQTTMPAGTPFVFTLRQEGQGNLARATPPDLNAQSGFADRFAIHAESDRLLSDGVREFTYTLRPRNEKVTEVPAVSVSSFNPKADRYEAARSATIPLKVTPAPPAAAAPGVAAAPAITSNDVIDEKLADPGTTSPDQASSWNGYVYAFALLLCTVSTVLVVRRYRQFRQHRVAQGSQQQAMDAVRQRLRAPHLSSSDVRLALQDFLRIRFNLPPGEITPKDVEEQVAQAGYGEKMAKWCAEALSRCEAAEFAPGAAPTVAELTSAAERVIRALLTEAPGRVVIAEVVDDLTREREAAVAR